MKILNCIPTLTPAHGEMCTTCTARLAVPSNHHTDYNIVMYRALLNFLYSLESKPLYFPVICKVLKKMQYTNGSVVFTLLSIVNTSGNFFIILHVFGTMCAPCQHELCQEFSLSSFIYEGTLWPWRILAHWVPNISQGDLIYTACESNGVTHFFGSYYLFMPI